MEKVRLDKYLWSIRLFKTRSLATKAIETGKVKWNSQNCKASKEVKIDDVYEIKTEDKKINIQVLKLINNRVGYPEAILCYLLLNDFSDEVKTTKVATKFFTGKRWSKTGKFSKKELRDRNQFFEKHDEE